MRLGFALVLALSAAGCVGTAPSPTERAALLVHRGQDRQAADVLRDYIAKHPDAVRERRMLIRVVAVSGDLGAAEREATALAERLGPNDPTPWIEMGHAYELAHRYEDALAMYDRAADTAPKDAAGPREGGVRAAAWGELELAAPRLEEALRRDSRDASTWHTLGLVRLKLHDFDGAKQAYESGLVADPGALENRLGLATLALAEGDAARALEQYDALTRARPKNGDLELGRAWALIKLGRFDEAEAALARAETLGGNARVIAAQRRLLARLRAAPEAQKNR